MAVVFGWRYPVLIFTAMCGVHLFSSDYAKTVIGDFVDLERGPENLEIMGDDGLMTWKASMNGNGVVAEFRVPEAYEELDEEDRLATVEITCLGGDKQPMHQCFGIDLPEVRPKDKEVFHFGFMEDDTGKPSDSLKVSSSFWDECAVFDRVDGFYRERVVQEPDDMHRRFLGYRLINKASAFSSGWLASFYRPPAKRRRTE